MSWDGSGNFTRTNGTQTGASTWANARDAGNNITASQQDTHDQDLADGIGDCLTKNGESKPTADFKPNADAAYSLGAAALRWLNVFLSGFIGDANGNELLKFSATASAVNEVTITNAATGNSAKVSATGGDSTVGLRLEPKSTGPMSLETISSLGSGRLTLTSGSPVPSADQTGATTVYFTPANGDSLELYDGTDWQVYKFSELSQATSDNTKSPAAVANNSNYDVFGWVDSGTLRATRGPAWSSDTSRGTGAGTTELELFEGRYVNKVAITNGPAARKGRYLGTIRSDGSAQINDSKATRGVWNIFNRMERFSTAGFSASRSTSSTTWTEINTEIRNQFVVGLDENAIAIAFNGITQNDTLGSATFSAISLDSTTVPLDTMTGSQAYTATAASSLGIVVATNPGIGFHFATAVGCVGANTGTWTGAAFPGTSTRANRSVLTTRLRA